MRVRLMLPAQAQRRLKTGTAATTISSKVEESILAHLGLDGVGWSAAMYDLGVLCIQLKAIASPVPHARCPRQAGRT